MDFLTEEESQTPLLTQQCFCIPRETKVPKIIGYPQLKNLKTKPATLLKFICFLVVFYLLAKELKTFFEMSLRSNSFETNRLLKVMFKL